MEYTENEKNELRKQLLSSIENNFFTINDTQKNINIDFNNINQEISLYKLVSENILMKKKIQEIENEINEIKKIMNS